MLTIKRILSPTDFSEPSATAAKYAAELARKFGAELHLLHVVEYVAPLFPLYGVNTSPPAELSEWTRSAEEQLDKLRNNDALQGVDVVSAQGVGKPHAEILDYSKEHEIDLMVLATHGRSGVARLLMGSVAENVLREAPCPVLTVRPGGRILME